MGFAPKRIAKKLLAASRTDPSDTDLVEAMEKDAAGHDYVAHAESLDRMQRIRVCLERIERERVVKRERNTEMMIGSPRLQCYAPGDGALSFTYVQERRKDGARISVGSPKGEEGMAECQALIDLGNYNPEYDLIDFWGQIRLVHRVTRVDEDHLRMTPTGYHPDHWKRDVAEGKTRAGYDEWNLEQVETYRYEKCDDSPWNYTFWFPTPEIMRSITDDPELRLKNISDRAALKFYLENEKHLLEFYGDRELASATVPETG